MKPKTCPLCGGRVVPVAYPANSPLNPDQFESLVPGDYFCTECPADPNRPAGSQYRYWTEADLDHPLFVQVSHPPVDPKEDTLGRFQTRLDLGGPTSSRWSDLPPGKYRLIRVNDPDDQGVGNAG